MMMILFLSVDISILFFFRIFVSLFGVNEEEIVSILWFM